VTKERDEEREKVKEWTPMSMEETDRIEKNVRR
jgi:hypothetical protein